MKKKLAFINMQMEKGKFSQNTTRFKDKSKNIQPVIIDTELVNSLIGNETNKAPSVAAVNDALDDKVDKITETWRAYTTDGNGKTVSKKLASNPAAGGVVLYNEGGILKTNAPVEDLDCVNKKTMDDGLAKKLDIILPSEVTAEYAYMISPYGNSIRRMSGVENTQGHIPTYRKVDDTDRGDQGGTINVTMPKFPYNAANKKFVEDGLAGKVDKDLTGKGRHRVYGVNGDTGAQRLYNIGYYNKTGEIPIFAPVTSDDVGKADFGATFGVAMPLNPYQAAPKKYVDDGLAGKLDAKDQLATGRSYVYAINYDNTQKLFSTSMHGSPGEILMYGATSNTGKSKPSGTIGVNMPEQPYQAVPKEYVDTNTPAHVAINMITEGEGEEKKEYVLRLSLVNRKGDVIPDSETSIDLPLEMAFVGAEAVEDENGNEFVEFTLQNGEKLRVGLSEIFKGKVDKITKSGNYAYVTNANGYLPVSASNYAGYIATYGSENGGKEDRGGYVTTSIPRNPYHSANKHYVDEKVAPLKRDIRVLNEAALGKLYTFETVYNNEVICTLPSGYLPKAYLQYIDDIVVALSVDGLATVLGTAKIEAITFLNADLESIGSYPNPVAGEYFEIPAGAARYSIMHGNFEWVDGEPTIYKPFCTTEIVLQVKVGE